MGLYFLFILYGPVYILTHFRSIVLILIFGSDSCYDQTKCQGYFFVFYIVMAYLFAILWTIAAKLLNRWHIPLNFFLYLFVGIVGIVYYILTVLNYPRKNIIGTVNIILSVSTYILQEYLC